MSRLSWLFILMVLPGLALAGPVPVRSGEHADFSRLVLYYRDVPNWQFGRVDGGYEFRPGGPSRQYDLSSVFALIPRTRIASVAIRPDGGLFLAVTCTCHADAFEIRAGLVIDIKDGGPAAKARFERSLPLHDTAPPVAGLPTTGGTGADPAGLLETRPAGDTGPPTPLIPLPWARSPQADLAWRNRLAIPSVATADTRPGESPAPETAAQIADVQRELVQQIGRAAAQGLVEPDLTVTRQRIAAVTAVAPAETATTGTSAAPAPDPPAKLSGDEPAARTDTSPPGHVRIETAIDAGELRAAPPAQLTAEGSVCLPPDTLDVANWGTHPAEGAALAPAGSDMVGEFDLADASGVAAQARRFIYLTFGAEAKSVLGAFAADVPDAGLLTVLANIMDGTEAKPPMLLADQLNCDTPVALWALLERPALTPIDAIASNAIVSAFAALPLHLRRHLVARVAEKLVQAGHRDAAEMVRDAVARAPGEHGAGLDLARAEIDLDNGDTEGASANLAHVIETDGPMAPQALIRLIDTKIDAGAPIAPDLIEMASVMSFEERGTETGAALNRARLRAMAHSGLFLETLREIETAESDASVDPQVAARLRRETFGLVATDAGDDVFLRAVLSHLPVETVSQLAAETRRATATRLIDLGLPDQARNLLADIEAMPTPQDRKIFAKSFIVERRADLAIGYLAGLKDDDSTRLRAAVHALANEYDRAAQSYAQAGDAAARARVAWRGGLLPLVGSIGTDAERAAADMVMTSAADSTADGRRAPVTLSRANDMVQRSQRDRATIAALLTQKRVP